MLKEDVLVVNFCSGERTEDLSEYCFRKLGFNNFANVSGSDGFVDKFLRFADIAMASPYEVFVRSDADRLVFSGINELIDKFVKDKVDCAEGYGFEFFMNRFRGATPHVFSRKILSTLANDSSLMPRAQKPECNFINNVVKLGLAKEGTYNIFTNLHEYEQYPSKVCNSLINRRSRGHLGYYDLGHLNSLTQYKEAVELSLNYSDEKKSMDHIDVTFLDSGFSGILEQDIEAHYDLMLQAFNSKRKIFDKEAK